MPTSATPSWTAAVLERADLTGARLPGVDLSKMTGLTAKQLRDAVGERTVLLPDLDAGAEPEPTA